MIHHAEKTTEEKITAETKGNNAMNNSILTSTSERCPAIIRRGCILSIDQILAVRSCEALAK